MFWVSKHLPARRLVWEYNQASTVDSMFSHSTPASAPYAGTSIAAILFSIIPDNTAARAAASCVGGMGGRTSENAAAAAQKKFLGPKMSSIGSVFLGMLSYACSACMQPPCELHRQARTSEHIPEIEEHQPDACTEMLGYCSGRPDGYTTGTAYWTAVNIGKVPVNPTNVRCTPNKSSSKFQTIARKGQELGRKQ